MGMTPVIGAAVGSVGGLTAGTIVGEALGAAAGTSAAQDFRMLAGEEVGQWGEVAVFSAVKRGARLSGGLIGCAGGTTTGAAVGVAIRNNGNHS